MTGTQPAGAGPGGTAAPDGTRPDGTAPGGAWPYGPAADGAAPHGPAPYGPRPTGAEATPARVLFVTWTAPGHLFPLTPLAWAIQAAGHEVRVAAPPACRDAVLRAGLCAVDVGRDAALTDRGRWPELAAWGRPARWPNGWTGDLDLLDPGQRRVVRALYERQCAVADAMLPDLVEYGRWWRPHLVVHDALAMAGPVLAAVLGVDAVGHGWEIGSTLHPPTGDRNAEPLPDYLELFARYGADPVLPVGWVDPCPQDLRPPDNPPVRRLPMACVPYNGSGAHPDWLPTRTGAPRLCLTAGVAGARYREGPDVLALAVQALAESGAEVLLAPGGPLDGGGLPDGVRVVRGVPFRMLLPACDLVVHHGGAGTALTAVVTGTPQVVVPPSPICAEIAHRVDRAGLGVVLDRPGGPEELAAAVAKALAAADHHRAAAARVRARMAALPTPTALADRLLTRCGR